MRKSKKHDQRQKILVADDDFAIVDSLQLMLEEIDYNVATSTNGKTISLAKKFHPNLILLDVWLSGKDGRDICRYLKGHTATKDIPIIMISAARDVAKSVKEAGAEDFISKPFDIVDLLEKVKKYIH